MLVSLSSAKGAGCMEADLKKNSSICCSECPAGYHIDKTNTGCITNTYKCKRCEDGKGFLAKSNAKDKCISCKVCSDQDSQVFVKPCVYNNDTVCACKVEAYQEDTTTSTRRLNCRSCSLCRDCKTCRTCEKCGPCKSGYYTDEVKGCQSCETVDCRTKPECHSCSTSTTTTKTHATTLTLTTSSRVNISTSTTPRVQVPNHYPTSPQLLVLLVVLVFILLGASLLGLTQVWTPGKDLKLPSSDSSPNADGQICHQPNSPASLTLTVSEGILMTQLSHSAAEYGTLVTPLLADREPRIPQPEARLERWSPTVLYTIIKEVPLRRWKEFLRLLSVPDHQLERVELEAGLGLGLLEKQYQMLKLWCQGPSADLENVYSALRYMDLDGCAHQLQDSLEHLHQANRTDVAVFTQEVTSPPHHHRTNEAGPSTAQLCV